MIQNYCEILSSSFLFAGLSLEEISGYTPYFTIQQYKKGDTVYKGKDFQHSLGIVLEGEALVSQKGVTLNIIPVAGAFGVSALFHPLDEFVTQVSAKTPLTVAFITGEKLKPVLMENCKISLNYIAFLSQRITFLNERIATLTAPSAQQRLLEQLHQMEKDGIVTVSKGYTMLASSLNMGRASLYRSLEMLEQEGFILRTGKTITLLNKPNEGEHSR